MTDKITFDSTEPPDIGVAQPGMPDQQVEDYIRVAHRPVLVLPPHEEQHKGMYWDAATATVRTTDSLGKDREDALSQFRAFLCQPR
jgi:hypothetical protein